jgi:hypothetical protein
VKTFQNQAAQGELFFFRVVALPKDVQEIQSQNGKHVVGHSETGHHHTIHESQAFFYGTKDPNVCYLKIDGEYADLVHERSFDTHETLRIPTGIFEVRKQQEYWPDGWRQVQD